MLKSFSFIIIKFIKIKIDFILFININLTDIEVPYYFDNINYLMN